MRSSNAAWISSASLSSDASSAVQGMMRIFASTEAPAACGRFPFFKPEEGYRPAATFSTASMNHVAASNPVCSKISTMQVGEVTFTSVR